LRRECIEEIGVDVDIAGLIYVAEYYKPRYAIPGQLRHQIDFIFSCTVPEDYIASNGPRPDKHQVDVVWIPGEQLEEITFYPPALTGHLSGMDQAGYTIYLGQIS
jgi:8-oxo-dGTP pyrophosphatase MutT (NUDIX family)